MYITSVIISGMWSQDIWHMSSDLYTYMREYLSSSGKDNEKIYYSLTITCWNGIFSLHRWFSSSISLYTSLIPLSSTYYIFLYSSFHLAIFLFVFYIPKFTYRKYPRRLQNEEKRKISRSTIRKWIMDPMFSQSFFPPPLCTHTYIYIYMTTTTSMMTTTTTTERWENILNGTKLNVHSIFIASADYFCFSLFYIFNSLSFGQTSFASHCFTFSSLIFLSFFIILTLNPLYNINIYMCRHYKHKCLLWQERNVNKMYKNISLTLDNIVCMLHISNICVFAYKTLIWNWNDDNMTAYWSEIENTSILKSISRCCCKVVFHLCSILFYFFFCFTAHPLVLTLVWRQFSDSKEP